MVAMQCDDSGDCPGDAICCAPERHGSDVPFETRECLSPKECGGLPERCIVGVAGACKRPGYACRRDGLCHPAK